MRIRKALPEDLTPAVGLARSLDLDYPGLESDRIWVAEEAGKIIGLVALKEHPDCRELCALGVDLKSRGRGVGKALVEALMAGVSGRVHLSTVIPGFFEACGFEPVMDVPATFTANRDASWCKGCPRERCQVLSRAKP